MTSEDPAIIPLEGRRTPALLGILTVESVLARKRVEMFVALSTCNTMDPMLP